MAKYSVHVFCDVCPHEHHTGINVILNDGPAERGSIDDTYAGKALPSSVATLHHNSVTCPNTGKCFVQEDNHQIFLVAIGD